MFELPLTQFIAHRRHEAGLSQTQLAMALGMSPKRLSKIERGERHPTLEERRILIGYFGELRGYTASPGHGRRLAENARRMRDALPEFHPAQEKPSNFRYYSALRSYPDFVRRLTGIIKERDDFLDCQFLCGQLALESGEEVLLPLRLLAQGALPGSYPPLWLGPLPHSIVDPTNRKPVGYAKFPCLVLPNDFYFFQVTFATPGLFRVDVLRWNETWSVIEIDGSGHRTAFDAAKMEAIGLPTRRFTPADLLADGFCLDRAA